MANSLFDAPSQGPFGSALDWITGLLLGELAIALCVIAIAFVGFIMLAGHLPIRRGTQVVLGCFILLGSPVIAASFSEAWRDTAAPVAPTISQGAMLLYEREELPAATYNPYARASVRPDD